MKGQIKDLTGQKFGRLTVVDFSHLDKWKEAVWNCICDCGNLKKVKGALLVRGGTKSCGCLLKEVNSKSKITHGRSYSPTYTTWIHMKDRCNNPKHTHFQHYGGRGIKICERWEYNFENFLEDMGERPKGYTLNRIDNDGGYFKENCLWSSDLDQANNKRTNVFLEMDGKKMTAPQWARELNIKVVTIRARLRRGFPIEKVLSTVNFCNGKLFKE